MSAGRLCVRLSVEELWGDSSGSVGKLCVGLFISSPIGSIVCIRVNF